MPEVGRSAPDARLQQVGQFAVAGRYAYTWPHRGGIAPSMFQLKARTLQIDCPTHKPSSSGLGSVLASRRLVPAALIPAALIPAALIPVLFGLLLSGCSGDKDGDVGISAVAEQDRLTVDVATNRQMQIGFQIASVAASDNAVDLCFEMCNRSSESCHLSASVCNVSKRYPAVPALNARCDVTRERCRSHRSQVPRQCPCEAH